MSYEGDNTESQRTIDDHLSEIAMLLRILISHHETITDEVIKEEDLDL